MIGDDGGERSHADPVAHQMNLLAQEVLHPAGTTEDRRDTEDTADTRSPQRHSVDVQQFTETVSEAERDSNIKR